MLFSLWIFLFPHFASTAGFSSGNAFTAHNLFGAITIYCDDSFNHRRESVYAHCRDQILDPNEADFFIASALKRATKLEILAAQENGKKVYKKVDYLGKEGRSKTRLNLWIATLFQTPLLDFGENYIEYELHDKNWKSLEKGSLKVQVQEGEPYTCRYRRTYFSNNINDCYSPQMLCNRYFQEENYCQ